MDAGLILQIDCVDLGGRRDAQTSLEDVREDRAMKIDPINQATKDLRQTSCGIQCDRIAACSQRDGLVSAGVGTGRRAATSVPRPS